MAANQWVLILLLTIGLGIFTGLVNDRFFNPRNIVSILEQSSVLGLVAAGATILIISGNFDISVGAIIGLAAVTMAMIVLAGYPEELAMLAGMAVAIICSIVNAVLARLFQAPTFIVSLATAGIFTGIALAMTEGIIQLVPNNFTFFSSTRLLGGNLPLIFLISLLGYVAVGFLLRFTRLGRRTYAIGDNPRRPSWPASTSRARRSSSSPSTASSSGWRPSCSSRASARPCRPRALAWSCGPSARSSSVGVPITGGRGGVVGTFFGVLLLGVISNMLNMLRINPFLQEIAFGSLIVLAIGISWLRTRVGRTDEESPEAKVPS